MTDPQTASASELESRLRADLKDALRQRDQVRIDTLRITLGAFHNEEVARTDSAHPQHRQPLTERDRVAILEKQIKQREEAAKIYRDAQRATLADQEEREAGLLQVYMPARLTDDAIRVIVLRLVEEQGPDFRKVMPAASRETKGRADGRRVQAIVRELTS
ncbi:MAG: GatB/YqeY domain-containing protein [Ktedonobacterales bacterium]|nr:GatB/YqeY domain-containing protein [Ktedonobacterales bacterium]